MEVIQVVKILVLVTFFSASVKSLEILTADGEYPCGSILNETSGVLQYKPFEEANEYERCVWIIRVPSASGYNFTVYNLGYSGSGSRNALHITGLHRGDHRARETIAQFQDREYFVNGSVAILTYYSETTFIGRGFSLYWTANFGGSTNIPVSQNSVTEIVSDVSRNISHPQNTSGLSRYDDLELSVFLYTPEFTNNGTSHENEVRFVQLGLDGCTCSDFIDIFVFDAFYAHASKGWGSYGRFCGPDSDVTFSRNDMLLFVFHSDASQNNTGFELIYKRKDL